MTTDILGTMKFKFRYDADLGQVSPIFSTTVDGKAGKVMTAGG